MMPPGMMMMHPMMAMMMSGMSGMGGMGGMMAPSGIMSAMKSSGDGGAATSASKAPTELAVDPQIRDLCRTFNIEERLMRKMDRIMKQRPESFDEDILTLRDRLGEPRSDVGVLITQLEKGLFVSLGCMPKEMVTLVKKYSLDDRASQRLAESMMKRKVTMKDDLRDLDIRLGSADRPSGLLMTLLQGLDTMGELPPPPKSLGLPTGRERDRGGHSHHLPADDRERGSSRRDRDRSKSRKKSRSPSKSRSKSRKKKKSRSRSKSRKRRR